MKNFKKIGLSALCGSLAAISAQAGEISVSGGATATWSSNEGDVTGNPIGMNTGLTFSGSGELDGGQTFALTITGADQAAYSAGSISLTTNGMGTFYVRHADGGAGIDAYDDKMPSAWEETWGTSLGTGIDLISGVGASSNISWTLPTIQGITLSAAWAPANQGGVANDKGVVGDKNSYKHGGYDLMLNINPQFDALSGLNIFVGGSESDREGSFNNAGTAGGEATGQHEEVVAGLTYAMGPVTVGYQMTGEFTGAVAAGETDYYKNTMWGVAFNVSDNLSISYGEAKSRRGLMGSATNESVEQLTDSLQVAYTMGGASIKIAETSGDNLKYTSGTGNDKDATTIALSLAF